MYSINKEQEVLFPWQVLTAFLFVALAMQFVMLRPQEVRANTQSQMAYTQPMVQPIHVKPVEPVKPKFLSIVDTSEKLRHNKTDEFCMAKNIYHEAGAEPTLGKYAVAQVTINRIKSPKYGDGVCEVVFEPYQFSWANNRHRRWTTPKGEQWEQAKEIAKDVLRDGKRIYGMDDALFYHATYVRPSWARTKDRLTRIGLHIFYNA